MRQIVQPIEEDGCMKLSRVLIYATVAILVVGAVGGGIATAHKKKFKTTVTITWHENDGLYEEGDTFDGDVGSKRKKCRKGRTVKLFRVQDNRLIGTDTTNGSGHYEVTVGGEAAQGDYFAKAKKKAIKNPNHKHICKKGKSQTISVR
jgi:hypothetical protein